MCGIFHYLYAMLAAHLVQFVHIAGQAAIVYTNNGLCFGGNEGANVVCVNIEGFFLYIGKLNFGAHVQEGDICSSAGKYRRNYFVVFLHIGQQIGKVQCICTRTNSQRSTVAAKLLFELTFELFYPRALTDPAGIQHIANVFFSIAGHMRVKQNYTVSGCHEREVVSWR